jgi:hypothetical protein
MGKHSPEPSVEQTNTLSQDSQVPDVQLAAPNGGIFCSAFK